MQHLKTATSVLLCIALGLLVLMAFGGCVTTPDPEASFSEVHTVQNNFGRVASKSDDTWKIKSPPTLQFTGATVTGDELRSWAGKNGIRVTGLEADGAYAQVTAESAVQCILWLKRFFWDIGYNYISEARDCDNFARAARTFPDFFADEAPDSAQAAVFGIYAKMFKPFAGVSDGYHALNVVWTDQGVFVFEPQGTNLTYQDIRFWPNKTGITHSIFD